MREDSGGTAQRGIDTGFATLDDAGGNREDHPCARNEHDDKGSDQEFDADHRATFREKMAAPGLARAAIADNRYRSVRLSAGSAVSCSLTWALHRHLRTDKANSFIELRNAVSRCAKHPGHSAIIAHDRIDQGAADAFAPMILRDDDHRNVAVGHAVGERAQEPHDLAILDRDEGDRKSVV